MPFNHYIHFGAPIVIEADVNDKIRFYDNLSWQQATITPGIYYTAGLATNADSLYLAIKTALNAAGNGDWQTAGDSAPFAIRNTSDIWQIDWDYYTDSFSEWSALGLTSSLSANGPGNWVTATNLPAYTWFPQEDPSAGPAYNLVSDSFAMMQHSASQAKAKSGRIWSVKTEDDYHEREWNYTYLALGQIYPQSGWTNRAWVLWVEAANNGQRIKVWEYAEGTYRIEYGYLDAVTASNSSVRKIQAGLDYYSLRIRMTRAFVYGYAL